MFFNVKFSNQSIDNIEFAKKNVIQKLLSKIYCLKYLSQLEILLLCIRT